MLKCECLYYTSYNEKVGHVDYNNVADTYWYMDHRIIKIPYLTLRMCPQCAYHTFFFEETCNSCLSSLHDKAHHIIVPKQNLTIRHKEQNNS